MTTEITRALFAKFQAGDICVDGGKCHDESPAPTIHVLPHVIDIVDTWFAEWDYREVYYKAYENTTYSEDESAV